jgi:hypothetical protein
LRSKRPRPPASKSPVNPPEPGPRFAACETRWELEQQLVNERWSANAGWSAPCGTECIVHTVEDGVTLQPPPSRGLLWLQSPSR